MRAGPSPRLGIVAPLPPQRTGVAGYALAQAEALAELTPVILFTGLDDGAEPDTDLPVRDISDVSSALAAGEIDQVVYHVGNSLENLAAVRAAANGPPGVVVLHDGTLHHLLVAAAPTAEAYADHLRLAHGDRGADIAAARLGGSSGDVDMALFDALAPVLRGHRLIVTHSRWLAGLVHRRLPEVDLCVVSLPAPAEVAAPSPEAVAAFRAEFGVDDRDEVIGLVGFLSRPKRPDLVLATVDRLRRRGRPVRLLIVGDDQSDGHLAEILDRHPEMRRRVTITGYLDPARFAAAVSSIDIVVALRSPHFGESSAVLATAFAHGRAVVAQRIGSSGELPAAVVSFHRPGGDEVSSLADHLDSLLDDPAQIEARSRAALDLMATTPGRADVARTLIDALAALPSVSADDTSVREPGPVFGDHHPIESPLLRRRAGWLLSRNGAVHPLDGAPYFGSTIDPDDPALALIAHDGPGVTGYTVVRATRTESFGPGGPPTRPADPSTTPRFGSAVRSDGKIRVRGTDRWVAVPSDGVWIDAVDGPDGVVVLAADGRLREPDRPHRRRRVAVDHPIGLERLDRGVVVIGATGQVTDAVGAPIDIGADRVIGMVVATLPGVDGAGLLLVTDAGRTYTVEGAPTALALAHQPTSPVVGGAWAPGPFA